MLDTYGNIPATVEESIKEIHDSLKRSELAIGRAVADYNHLKAATEQLVLEAQTALIKGDERAVAASLALLLTTFSVAANIKGGPRRS